MSENAITVKSLFKGYKRQPVLTGVNLQVRKGEFFGLVGMNGAGKTTLIKSLLDFCQIDRGSIELFATRHTNTRARKRLAFLPERFTPPYYLTGREFLRYMGSLHGISYRREDVDYVFRHLDLDSTAMSRPVRSYSKGMAQKLGLATCFLSQRELMVLDEPMSGLDPKARAMMKSYLLEIKEKGQTLFFSTHMLNDVDTLCDRLAILHHGEIRFVGSPAECCEIYAADNLEMAYLKAIENSQTLAGAA